MGVAGRVEHTSASIGHMGNNGNEPERVHELDGRLAVAFQSEGHHATRPVGQVFLSQLVTGISGQSAIVNPCHAVVGSEELGHPLCILTMAGHAQVQRFQSEVQQKRIMGRRNAP